jgi:gamma-glutamyltranspeptidase/glutathione hydrolase
MGGFQAIWFHPYGVQGAGSSTIPADQPISGIYRAASDHRKDGEAVGW